MLGVKDNTRPNRWLNVAFGESPLGPWKDLSEPFSTNFTEGPTVLKLGNEWHIYFDTYQERIYRAVKTGDFKIFTDVTHEMSFPEGHKHGTIFKAPESVLTGLKEEVARRNQ